MVLKYKAIVVEVIADARYVITSNYNSTLADATKKWKTRTKKKDPRFQVISRPCRIAIISANTLAATPTIHSHA